MRLSGAVAVGIPRESELSDDPRVISIVKRHTDEATAEIQFMLHGAPEEPTPDPAAPAPVLASKRECDLSSFSEPWRTILEGLAAERREHKTKESYHEKMMESAQTERKAKDREIEDLLKTANFGRVILPYDWIVEQCNGGTPAQLVVTKLLELGVSPDVIRRATAPGGKYTYVKVRPLTAKELEAKMIRDYDNDDANDNDKASGQ